MLFFLMSPTNFLMLSLLTSSVLITLFSNSWFSAWMGLEINTMAFITTMSSSNQESSESSMLYFLPQALASSIFIMSSTIPMLLSKSFNHYFIFTILILSSLSLKLGAAPLHQWFPKVAKTLPWHLNSLLMTLQKIPPMFLMSLINHHPLLLVFIVSSAITGSIGGLSQTNMKTILAFSSISHMAWMLASFLINTLIWMMYLSIYSIIILPLISIFFSSKITTLNQLASTQKLSPKTLLFTLLLLSLGGMPPLLGFFPKWIIISTLNSYTLLTILIMSTLLNLFFYLRISYSTLFLLTPSIPPSHHPFLPSSTPPLIILTILAFPLITPPLIMLSNI